MKKGTILTGLLAIALLIVSTATAGGPPFGAFWADGMVFKTVIAPNSLPNKGPKDGLYVFDGLDGQNPVAEAKPGDQDYNGGRWQVYVLQFTADGIAAHDGDGDGAADFQLMSWEMVQTHIGLGHLEQVAMGPSFVCPLIK
ncbi:MAG: hypothetical protein OEV49_17590 [candidate division Zixibacteria bacterium]|nr:hypothetical protein [candidate division Zixibacteria bacterium]MDH3938419.1 hypothetical protein [candidate division Zixibacteria bacterium]MDH4035591.1 hypothetical protein [candidate division Zixibacteria bacterium]